eukprot:Gb_30514 [translate_table: standard]
MDDLSDTTLRMKVSRPLLLDMCATPRHNWRSVSWCKKPTFSPPTSPIPETNSSNVTGETSHEKVRLCDDTEESIPEQEVPSSSPLFFDSQGRNMQLLCPPLQDLSVSKCPNKEPISGLKMMITKNGVQMKIDLNCVEEASYDEEDQAEDSEIVRGDEVQEESEDRGAECDKECSQVLPYLFLGSRTVAQKLATLHSFRITHILNCVGFACAETFPNDFSYKTLWLQDSPSEDLTCILYDVFDYIEEVHKQANSRLFVHCCQGVSRSVALVIAYLMWKEHRSFDEAFAFVKAARCVASPNIGFVVQLIQWQARIQNPPSENTLCMYRVAPHSPYSPLHLVPKSVANPSIGALDSRCVFIIQLGSTLYVWRGKKSDREMAAAANRSAFQMVRYEHAQGPLVSCNEGFESAELREAMEIGNGEAVEESERKPREPLVSLFVGEKLVAEYETDYQLFWKAKLGGYVPPVAGTGATIYWPAKEESWGWLQSGFNCTKLAGLAYEMTVDVRSVLIMVKASSHDALGSRICQDFQLLPQQNPIGCKVSVHITSMGIPEIWVCQYLVGLAAHPYRYLGMPPSYGKVRLNRIRYGPYQHPCPWCGCRPKFKYPAQRGCTPGATASHLLDGCTVLGIRLIKT